MIFFGFDFLDFTGSSPLLNAATETVHTPESEMLES